MVVVLGGQSSQLKNISAVVPQGGVPDPTISGCFLINLLLIVRLSQIKDVLR